MFHVPLQRLCATVDIRNGEDNGNHAKIHGTWAWWCVGVCGDYGWKIAWKSGLHL